MKNYSTPPLKKALSILNSKNLSDLFGINCVLSLIERFDEVKSIHGQNFLFPMLNIDKLNHFSKAILDSKALDYKNGIISESEFGQCQNFLIDQIDWDYNSDNFISKNDEIEKTLFQIVNSQIRFQRKNFKRKILRSYALFQFYPEKYAMELKLKHGKKYISVVSEFEQDYQINPHKYLYCSLIIFLYYQNVYKSDLPIPKLFYDEEEKLREIQGPSRDKFCSEMVEEIIKQIRNSKISKKLFINPENILLTKVITSEQVKGFLNISASGIRQ